VPKGEYEEFIVKRVNFNTARNNGEERLYKENDPYFKPNNVGHYDIT
jgi:hypothetical protein